MAQTQVSRFAVAVLMGVAAGVAASEPHGPQAPGARWWDRHAEGWFWYKDPPEPVKEPQPKPQEKKPPQVVVLAPPKVEAPAGPGPEETAPGPPPLSAAWLKANLPRYLERALDDPTPENVRVYLYLQRVAMDKASRFTDAVQAAVIGDPVLDEYAAFPTGTQLGQVMMRMARSRQDGMLDRLAKEVGIFFFYSGSCEECALQLGVLDTLERVHGFTVVLVSLDGSPPPGLPGRRFRVDRGQAARLGISRGPALVLAKPPGDLAPVAHGLMPFKELKRRILAVAVRQGWIEPERYEETRPAWPDGLWSADAAGVLPEEIRVALGLEGGS